MTVKELEQIALCKQQINGTEYAVLISSEYKALHESLSNYEQLQQDINRYMELDCDDKPLTQEEYVEWERLIKKLSKVGKEE